MDLLTQVVFVVVAIHRFAHALLYLLLQHLQADFAPEQLRGHFEALTHVKAFQNLLLGGKIADERAGHDVTEHARALFALDALQKFIHRHIALLHDLPGKRHDRAHIGQRFNIRRLSLCRSRFRDRAGLVVIRAGLHIHQQGADLALKHQPERLIGHGHDLPNGGDGAHGVQILQCRMIHRRVPLRDHQQPVVAAHRRLDGCDGAIATRVERNRAAREDRQPAQGQQRQLYFVLIKPGLQCAVPPNSCYVLIIYDVCKKSS